MSQIDHTNSKISALAATETTVKPNPFYTPPAAIAGIVSYILIGYTILPVVVLLTHAVLPLIVAASLIGLAGVGIFIFHMLRGRIFAGGMSILLIVTIGLIAFSMINALH